MRKQGNKDVDFTEAPRLYKAVRRVMERRGVVDFLDLVGDLAGAKAQVPWNQLPIGVREFFRDIVAELEQP